MMCLESADHCCNHGQVLSRAPTCFHVTLFPSTLLCPTVLPSLSNCLTFSVHSEPISVSFVTPHGSFSKPVIKYFSATPDILMKYHCYFFSVPYKHFIIIVILQLNINAFSLSYQRNTKFEALSPSIS